MIKSLIHILDKQWQHNQRIECSIWQSIYDQFPEFRYHGTGYRAVIICDPKKNSYESTENLNSGKAWTADMDGLKNFLYNTYLDDDDYEIGDKVFVIEADIYGIDLVKIMNYLKSQGERSIPISAVFEKEIISLSSNISKEYNCILKDLIPN